MKRYQLNYVNKPNRESPHEHITHIGQTGNKWTGRAWPDLVFNIWIGE